MRVLRMYGLNKWSWRNGIDVEECQVYACVDAKEY